jgi:hypothetical protein
LATRLLGIFKETDPIIFEISIENAKTTNLLRSGDIVVISAGVLIGKSGPTLFDKKFKAAYNHSEIVRERSGKN